MAADSRLVLGTVQLGMDYGVANATGKPDQKIAEDIIRTAWEGGIREFDTAQGYGDSEEVLGTVFHNLGLTELVKVISKPAPEWTGGDAATVMQPSIEKLGVRRLHGVMWHREGILESAHEAVAGMASALRDSGVADLVGVSVYSPEKAVTALESGDLDMVQLPGNVFDRRFEQAGVFELAADLEKIVYMRSVFLQGLICMPPEAVSVNVPLAMDPVKRLRALAADFGLSVLTFCLVFAREAYPKARILVGVETRAQLDEILEGWNVSAPEGICKAVQEVFSGVDERVVNPSLWRA